ncbi:oxygenase MpaB family protein, partial [Mesorhizobium japonicum]|uniref:oxygenase MpaB family protein n=1 Tax=Mesorhizobium japonicum TaxID=2066070 RepID=UPI003B58EA74
DYGVLVGDERQRERGARFTDAAHHGVPGARDVDRQLWVAATLYEVGRSVHERLGGPLPPEVDAEVLAASAGLATALQVPQERWPADRAAFDAYWRDAVARLEGGDDAG